MIKNRMRGGLHGVVVFLVILLVMAELVGTSALPADFVSFIESGMAMWVGGLAGLGSATWLIYDLKENGWADRPVLEKILRYSDRGLLPEPNELANLSRDPKCIEMLEEMSAEPRASGAAGAGRWQGQAHPRCARPLGEGRRSHGQRFARDAPQ